MPCRELLEKISSRLADRASLLVFLKEYLLHFIVNADQPFFRVSSALPKIIRLCFKFACSFLHCPQLGRKAVGMTDGSLALCLRCIGRSLHQGEDSASGIIRHHSGIRRPVFRGKGNYRSWGFDCFDAHPFPFPETGKC